MFPKIENGIRNYQKLVSFLKNPMRDIFKKFKCFINQYLESVKK